jgi:hypothetical protein
LAACSRKLSNVETSRLEASTLIPMQRIETSSLLKTSYDPTLGKVQFVPSWFNYTSGRDTIFVYVDTSGRMTIQYAKDSVTNKIVVTQKDSVVVQYDKRGSFRQTSNAFIWGVALSSAFCALIYLLKKLRP